MFRPVVAIIRFYHSTHSKIILYNSRGGVFDDEISTSKPLLGHSTSVLGVWVNHVIIHKSITLYCQNKNKKHEGPVLGKPLVVSSSGPGLIACRFLHLSGVELYRIILIESNDKT